MSSSNKHIKNFAQTLTLTQGYLTDLATSENFWSVFTTSFGVEYHTDRANLLLEQWQQEDFSSLPSIEVVSSDILGSANAAYAASKKTIYVSDAFLATASSQSLVKVLLEEYGHYVDAYINDTDSAGDEGAIFSSLVLGESLSAGNRSGGQSGKLTNMDEKHLLEIGAIDAEDWEKTPASVRNLVVKLVGSIEQLEKHLKELQEANEKINEKVNRNSQNSNSPPALDPLDVQPLKKKKKPGTKKRGGQPGHQGHSRFLYPAEECEQINNYYPQRCSCCGEKLIGIDPNPYRHQVVEIPQIQLEIIEHRLHQLSCHNCGGKNRAVLPPLVEKSGYGERVVAIAALMSGMYHHSQRMVVSAMSDFFGLNIALGTVNRLRNQASEAVSLTVDEAQVYVQAQPIVGADETGFKQGNAVFLGVAQLGKIHRTKRLGYG